jgi:hypothetical protein
MNVEHIVNHETGKTWCGKIRLPVPVQAKRKCRDCTYQRELARRREARRVLARCPRCRKLIALIFPIHDCRPAVKRRK